MRPSYSLFSPCANDHREHDVAVESAVVRAAMMRGFDLTCTDIHSELVNSGLTPDQAHLATVAGVLLAQSREEPNG